MKIAGQCRSRNGANRGIGRALAEEALRRSAKRVYAGTRQSLDHPDRRVTPLSLDVTDAAQTQAAVDKVESLDILINNAGVALFDDLSDRAALERHLDLEGRGLFPVPIVARAPRGMGVSVHAVLTGPVDTDMNRGFDIPMSSPESVATGILEGVERGEEEIFPDPMSASMAESWRGGAAKALERQNAAFVATPTSLTR